MVLDKLECSIHGRRYHLVRLLVDYLSSGLAEWLFHDHIPRPWLLETHIANTVIHSVLRDLCISTLRYLLQIILSTSCDSVKENLKVNECILIMEC